MSRAIYQNSKFFILEQLNLARSYYYCQKWKKPLQDKCFIIKTKEGNKKIVYESQIMKHFREQQINSNLYPQRSMKFALDKLMTKICEFFMKTQQKSADLMKSMKIKENMIKIKEAQKEKLQLKVSNVKEKVRPEKLKEIPSKIKGRWQIVKASEKYKSFRKSRKFAQEISNITIAHTCKYYTMFMQSPYKYQITKVISWSYDTCKDIATKLLKFINEAYFDKSTKNNFK